MKLLFACGPSHGRFFPVASLALAAVRAGHEVLAASASEIHPLITAAGLTAANIGCSVNQLRDAMAAKANEPIVREDRIAARLFTELWPAQAIPDLLALSRQWRPDAILHEEGEFSAPIVASLLKVPNIAITWGGPLRFTRQWRSLEHATAGLWRAWGLSAPPLAGLFRSLLLDQCPPSLRLQGFRRTPKWMDMRPYAYDGAASWALPVPFVSGQRPLVFATLGTVPAFNKAPGVFSAIISALADEPLDLIVTIGSDNRVEELGDIPSNTRVLPFIPQSLLRPTPSLVICHGGPGTAVNALARGTPLLLIPRGGAVQMRVSTACERTGVAKALAQSEMSPPALRSAVRTLLDDCRYAKAAAATAAEIATMPDHSEVLLDIEAAIERSALSRVSVSVPIG